jgi:hypothetical protein
VPHSAERRIGIRRKPRSGALRPAQLSARNPCEGPETLARTECAVALWLAAPSATTLVCRVGRHASCRLGSAASHGRGCFGPAVQAEAGATFRGAAESQARSGALRPAQLSARNPCEGPETLARTECAVALWLAAPSATTLVCRVGPLQLDPLVGCAESAPASPWTDSYGTLRSTGAPSPQPSPEGGGSLGLPPPGVPTAPGRAGAGS